MVVIVVIGVVIMFFFLYNEFVSNNGIGMIFVIFL